MRVTLVQLTWFVAKWRKLGFTDEDLQSLESLLIENPNAGDVIPGTGGIRKMRFAPPSLHTGKRGASRVIYAYIAIAETIYLFTLYTKKERSDVTPDEKKVFKQVLDRLHKFHASKEARKL